VSNHSSIETIQNLNSLIISLPDYRAEKFGRKVTEFAPFKKRFLYYKNYWIFERFENDNSSYKLDVFFESNGSAKVVMWNTVKKEKEGYETVKDILTKIGLINRFGGKSLYNGLTSEFNFSGTYPNLENIDNAVIDLVQSVFRGLSNKYFPNE